MLGDADSLALEQARDQEDSHVEPPLPAAAKRGRKRKNIEEPVSIIYRVG